VIPGDVTPGDVTPGDVTPDLMRVPARIVSSLRCPRCGEPVGSADGPGSGFECVSGHVISARNGYLDVSGEQEVSGSTDKTFASFGYEWNTFADVRTEDAGFAEVYFRDLDFKSLNGKVGLDAGCGKGRYTRFVAPHLEALAALDGSDAVIAASKNLSEFANVTVIKSDLRLAPFAPESFDFICSLGVLHHLDDPHEGFERLVELLAPGGTMLLYLYSRPAEFGARRLALSASAAFRKVTLRMPHKVLKPVSNLVATALRLGVVMPGRFGEKHRIKALAGLPMYTYRDKPFRSLELDTFDRLSAPVEHRYVWADLAPWFDRAGLTVDAHRDEAGWFVLAHRSTAQRSTAQRSTAQRSTAHRSTAQGGAPK
jgi:SAM-dependent methyltransferase